LESGGVGNWEFQSPIDGCECSDSGHVIGNIESFLDTLSSVNVEGSSGIVVIALGTQLRVEPNFAVGLGGQIHGGAGTCLVVLSFLATLAHTEVVSRETLETVAGEGVEGVAVEGHVGEVAFHGVEVEEGIRGATKSGLEDELEGHILGVVNALVASLCVPVEVETVAGEGVDVDALVTVSNFNGSLSCQTTHLVGGQLEGVIAHFTGSLVVVFAILDYFSHRPLSVVLVFVSGVD